MATHRVPFSIVNDFGMWTIYCSSQPASMQRRKSLHNMFLCCSLMTLHNLIISRSWPETKKKEKQNPLFRTQSSSNGQQNNVNRWRLCCELFIFGSLTKFRDADVPLSVFFSFGSFLSPYVDSTCIKKTGGEELPFHSEKSETFQKCFWRE